MDLADIPQEIWRVLTVSHKNRKIAESNNTKRFSNNNLWRSIWSILYRRGLGQTIHWMILDFIFDVLYGVETCIPIGTDRLHTGDVLEQGTAYGYAASSVSPMRRALYYLAKNATGTTFVDFGCGKGRVLIAASQLSFLNLVGVELSSGLAEVCRSNMKSLGIEADIVEVDATNFLIPSDAGAFYLYNPFDENVLLQVMKNIEGSCIKYPRPCFIAYINPVHQEVIASFSGVIKVYSLVHKGIEDLVVYKLEILPQNLD